MRRCEKCGASFEGNFCGNCGEKFVEKLMHFEDDAPKTEKYNNKNRLIKSSIITGIAGLVIIILFIVIKINDGKINKEEALDIVENAMDDYINFYNYGVVDDWMQLMNEEEWGYRYNGRKIIKGYKISKFGYGCLSDELVSKHFGACNCMESKGMFIPEYHGEDCVNKMLAECSKNIYTYKEVRVLEDSEEIYFDKKSIELDEYNKSKITGTCAMRVLGTDEEIEYKFTIEIDEDMNFKLIGMDCN